MNARLHRGWVLLGIVALWAVMPAMACLLRGPHTANHACCAAMMPGCTSATMGAASPCCDLRAPAGQVVSIGPYSAERTTKLAVLLNSYSIPSMAAENAPMRSAMHGPAATISPGTHSILRI